MERCNTRRAGRRAVLVIGGGRRRLDARERRRLGVGRRQPLRYEVDRRHGVRRCHHRRRDERGGRCSLDGRRRSAGAAMATGGAATVRVTVVVAVAPEGVEPDRESPPPTLPMAITSRTNAPIPPTTIHLRRFGVGAAEPGPASSPSRPGTYTGGRSARSVLLAFANSTTARTRRRRRRHPGRASTSNPGRSASCPMRHRRALPSSLRRAARPLRSERPPALRPRRRRPPR